MALENFTTYTEVDGDSSITVAANTITWTATEPRNSAFNQRVVADFGAGRFSGDFTHKFKVNLTSVNTPLATIYGAVWALGNSADDMTALEAGDTHSVLAVQANSVWSIQLRLSENGAVRVSSITVSAGTNYYVTVSRDDDGGANGTGQLTLRVYTTDYYGEPGAVEVGTTTLDCSAGEQNDFQFVFATNDYDNTALVLEMSLTISDLDLGNMGYVDMAGAFTGTSSFSGGLIRVMSGAPTSTKTQQRAITVGNNQFWYEDI